MSNVENNIVEEAIKADAAEIPATAEEHKDYFPPMGKAEFATTALGKAWDVMTDGVLNIMKSEDMSQEDKDKNIVALLQNLRVPHIRTVQHVSELIDNYEYHIREQRNFDSVVEFIIQDSIIGVKNNLTAIPRTHFAERNPETDKDPNWQYGAVPFERIFRGEHIPVKIQTNTHTAYGWLECLNHQVPNPADPTKVINIQTTVPCLRVKKGNIAINAIWRWQEVSEDRLKQHWLKGEDFFESVPRAKAQPAANPIEKAPETEGKENVDSGKESSDANANE